MGYTEEWWEAYYAELEADRDQWKALAEERNSNWLAAEAERDRYHKTLLQILLLTENHVQTQHWIVAEIEREVHAALSPGGNKC